MTKAIRFDLLKEAYAIIGGIPANKIDLNSIELRSGETLCGSICCGIGWLGHHPKFTRLGLKTTTDGNVSYKGHLMWFDEAAAKLFNISTDDAENLFGPAGSSEYDPSWSEQEVSHKRAFLRRMRAFLHEHGQLKHQLAKKKKS